MDGYFTAPASAGTQAPAALDLAEELKFRARPTVEMIAAPVVALREIDQLASDAGRPRSARQPSHLAGHLAAMIAVGKRRRRFAHCQ
jgi:hypothetical protein